jgi:hypothetical protein
LLQVFCKENNKCYITKILLELKNTIVVRYIL